MCTQVLYLISAFRVFPQPGFAVMDAVLPYVSVRSLPPIYPPVSLFPADLVFFFDIVTIAGSLPDSRRHLCRPRKNPDIRNNETTSTLRGSGPASTAIDTVQHPT